MKKRKLELGYSYRQISELSGVPFGTVQKIFRGATKAPRYETLCALEKVFIQPPSGGAVLHESPSTYIYGQSSDTVGIIRESSPAYYYVDNSGHGFWRKKQVVVYDFGHDDSISVYGFDSQVSVGIFEGECVIDFAGLYDYISFLYEALEE